MGVNQIDQGWKLCPNQQMNLRNVSVKSLIQLRRHDFIAKQQSHYCTERKETLQDGDVLVIGDISEKYSFVLQDAAQGYHWNNAQATLHPFVRMES